MREYSFAIREALTNGIAPDARMQEDTPYLESCVDLQASELGLIAAEEVSVPSSWMEADSQILLGDVNNLYIHTSSSQAYPDMELIDVDTWLSAGEILSSDGKAHYNISSSDTILHASGQQYTYVQNGGFWFLCGEDSFLHNCAYYVPDSSTPWFTTNSSTFILPRSVGTYYDRSLYAGLKQSTTVTSTWTALWNLWKVTNKTVATGANEDVGTSYVMIGMPLSGSRDMPFAIDCAVLSSNAWTYSDALTDVVKDAIRKGAIDFIKVPHGEVKRAEQLGARIILYTDSGIYAAVQREEGGFAIQKLLSTSITTPQHVTIGVSRHYAVDRQGILWIFYEDSLPKKLGYQHILGDIVGNSNFKLSYDQRSDNLYIAGNSVGYVLNKEGLTQLSSVVTGIFEELGTTTPSVKGTYRGTNSSTFELTTYIGEATRRSQKHVHSVEVSYRGLSEVKVSALVQYQRGSAWQSTASIPVNKEGVAYVRVIGADYKIKVEGEISDRTTATIDRITVRWRPTDSRYIRGLTEQNASYSNKE